MFVELAHCGVKKEGDEDGNDVADTTVEEKEKYDGGNLKKEIKSKY